jgi:hypothetical protein
MMRQTVAGSSAPKAPSDPRSDASAPIEAAGRWVRTAVALLVIMAICAAMRFYQIGAASLWTDEIFSRTYANLFGVHYLLTDGIQNEATPPTYYLLLQQWMRWFGDDEVGTRSFSLLAGVLCVPVVYGLGRELGAGAKDRRLGLLAAVLFTLSPVSLYFAQEARVYELLMLSTAGLLWAGAVFQRNPRSVGAWLGVLLCGVLVVYLHATGIVIEVSCAAAVWLGLLVDRATRRPAPVLRWMGLNAVVVALWVPYYVRMGDVSRGGGLDWMPHLGPGIISKSLTALAGGIVMPFPLPGLPLAALLFGVLAAALVWRPPGLRAITTLLLAPAIFLVLVMAISISRPILLPRILAWMTVPLVVFIAGQLLRPGRLRLVVLGGVVAAFGVGLFYQETLSEKEPWRQAMQAMAPEMNQADLVVISPSFDPMVLTTYAPQVRPIRLWDDGSRPTIMTIAAEKLHIPMISRDQILDAIRAGKRVVVLANILDVADIDALRDVVPAKTHRVWTCGTQICAGAAGWATSK